MTDEQVAELEAIRQRHPKKLLVAGDVWRAAQDPQSTLHGEFTWDTQEAAEKYWETEARNLIRAFVHYEPRIDRRARGYVSVPTDRENGGGYRPLGEVLDRPDFIAQLIEEVQHKLDGLKESYRYLKPLDPLWAEIDRAVYTFLSQRGQKAA